MCACAYANMTRSEYLLFYSMLLLYYWRPAAASGSSWSLPFSILTVNHCNKSLALFLSGNSPLGNGGSHPVVPRGLLLANPTLFKSERAGHKEACFRYKLRLLGEGVFCNLIRVPNKQGGDLTRKTNKDGECRNWIPRRRRSFVVVCTCRAFLSRGRTQTRRNKYIRARARVSLSFESHHARADSSPSRKSGRRTGPEPTPALLKGRWI